MADVLLIFPGKKEKAPRLPLSVLYLATALKKAGYQPKVLDMRVESFKGLKEDDFIFAGISTMSGSQIKYGLDVARSIRAKNPSLPLVWGGVHPTLLPGQTLKNEYVDIVVRGDGERTIVELADALKTGQRLDGIKGLTFEKDGAVFSTPDREFVDIDTIGNLDYSLVPLDRYLDVNEYFSYQSSRGCPHECIFCYNQCYNRGIWRKKKPEVVIEELRYLVESLGISSFIFQEDNFFVSKERVRQICTRIIEEGWDIHWTALNRVDYFCQYEEHLISF